MAFLTSASTPTLYHATMALPVYRVKLNPSDDAHVEHHVGGPFGTTVKMLTEDEANTLRGMIKDEVGKTVGKVGALDGEQYEIMSTFPNIHDIHTFVRGLESDSVSFDTYYTAKYSGKAAPTTTYQCSPAMATCDGLSPVNHILNMK
jgi:hypothetical protein